MRRALVLALIAVLLAGCLSPPKSYGCCLRANATAQDPPGCVLYNTTDYLEYPEYFGDTVSCDPQTGCNVSIDGDYRQLPICTDDQMVPCIEPNCTTMVCGDFAFTPRIAPGFSSVDESAGDAPTDVEEAEAMNLYKAQCRFLPMDADLSQIMKNSKSQVNVFRMGVGSSFDEYSQYRYFFPISDQYCSLSAAAGLTDMELVDRYMNYVTPESSDYVPVGPTGQITDNCIDDTESVAGSDSPFGFSDYSGPMAYAGLGSGTYSPILPDKSNYKFTYKARMDASASWDDDLNAYVYDDAYIDPFEGIYKAVDEYYYRKRLAIAHVEHIYGLGDTAGGGRASFECDSASSDCYSGVCSTDVYSRGVLLEEAEGGTYSEVITDCNQVTDNMGFITVVCSPTKSVTANGDNPPSMEYSGMSVKAFHMTLESRGDSPRLDYNEAAEDELDDENEPLNELFITWDGLDDIYDRADTGISSSWDGYYEIVYNEEDLPEYVAKDWVNPASQVEYEWDDDEDEWDPDVEHEDEPPPAGGIVFFGKVGEGFVNYDDSDIIGYSTSMEEEFKETLFYKNCGLSEDDYIVVNLGTQEQWTGTLIPCTSDDNCTCMGGCVDSRCNVGLCQTKYNVKVTPDTSHWEDLQEAFRPYFLNYVQNGLVATNFEADGCGDDVDALDVVFAAMPWVVNFEKGLQLDHELYPIAYHLTSASAQAIRERDIYDVDMADEKGTTSCQLRRSAKKMLFSSLLTAADYYYNVLFASELILIKNPSDGKLGKCVVDSESTGLPKVRTFGWCEPCTTATLAYQKITAKEGVYLPLYSMDIGTGTARQIEELCDVAYDFEWEGEIGYDDNVSCFNQHISDLGDYRGSLGDKGSPRTEPEATILKERLGDYLKAGVMPILDMSDHSNWEMENPEQDGEMFLKYDFETLFGSMGAVVVIVEHVQGTPDGPTVERIVNRSTMVRAFCPRCLTAIHVDSPDSNDSFKSTILGVTGDPRANANLDMVTFDYSVSDHSDAYDGIDGLDNKAYAVAEDIASYGIASLSLQTKGKPTMVVGLSVDDNDPVWKDSESYTKLFQGIVLGQKALVNAGVTGLLYAPVSTTINPDDADGPGLVDRRSVVQGIKTPKFCAYQNAMQTMSMTPTIAMFNKMPAWTEEVECVKCTALDNALGVCGEDADPDPRICDDGSVCVVGGLYVMGDVPTNLKCPDDTVSQECKVCSEISGSYTCVLSYANGTTQTITGPMSEVTSDIYMDIVAGLSSPDKCCLVAGEGDLSAKYTYMKDLHQSPVAQPIAFSKSGDLNMDCGMGTGVDDVTAISGFCGLPPIPLRDYDIECVIDTSYSIPDITTDDMADSMIPPDELAIPED